jgi:hypothetical protein
MGIGYAGECQAVAKEEEERVRYCTVGEDRTALCIFYVTDTMYTVIPAEE